MSLQPRRAAPTRFPLTSLRPLRARLAVLALAAPMVALMAGCGGGREGGASQTAAKVNKDEITVHQINFLLQQQRNLRPEQADAAGRQLLERLIDQQLAVQKAEDMKLDRDPRVVQALEAARREVIARAYIEKLGEDAPKPTPEDIKAYYDAKPALFAQRRVYNIQEIAIEARPEQVAEIRQRVASMKSAQELVAYLQAGGLRFAGNQAVRAAEQIPAPMLDTMAKLQDGQALVLPSPQGAQVIVLAGSRLQPVTEEQARPVIEQQLLAERRRKLVEDDIKSLRAAAKIEYVGTYAQAASAPGAPLATGGAVPAAASAAGPALPAATAPAASGSK